MINIFIYMQLLGILFGYSVLSSQEVTKIQLTKVILFSILPTLLYLNMQYLGIKGIE